MFLKKKKNMVVHSVFSKGVMEHKIITLKPNELSKAIQDVVNILQIPLDELEQNEPVFIICEKCNNNIPNDVKICPECGSDTSKSNKPKDPICSQCQKTVANTTKFCPDCGTAIKQ